MNIIDKIMGDPWKENIVLASVPLWKYENSIPVANASGCLIQYAGRKFIISIAHASIAESEWNVEVSSVEETAQGLHVSYQPVFMNSLYELNVNSELNHVSEGKIVDFTYRRLNDEFTSKHVAGIINNNFISADRTIFTPDFNNIHFSKSKKYGFYGNVKFSGVEGRRIVFEHRLEHDLKFIENRDGNIRFQLPHKYGSHDNYLGCSGAPIIDEDNNLVALVSFGERSTNSIFGVDISRYRAALEIDSQI